MEPNNSLESKEVKIESDTINTNDIQEQSNASEYMRLKTNNNSNSKAELTYEQTNDQPHEHIHEHTHHHQHDYETITQRGTHRHQHKHDISMLKLIKMYIFYTDNMINDFIFRYAVGFDYAIAKSRIPKMIKRFIHSKQLLLAFFISLIELLISQAEDPLELENSYRKMFDNLSFYLMIISVIILHVHFIFSEKLLFLQPDVDIENYVLKRNPQMKHGRCHKCKLIKTMRSFHCPMCDHCVNKFNIHSDWFNVCVGSANELLYLFALLSTILYIGISLLILFYNFIFEREILGLFVYHYTFCLLIHMYVFIKSFIFAKTFIFDFVLKDLSLHEKTDFRFVTYLQSEPFSRRFFNPFDKGVKRNIQELLVNTFNTNIYKNYEESYGHLEEIIEEQNINNNKYYCKNDDKTAYQQMVKLSENFEPVVSSKGFIYKMTDGKEIINWNKLRMYTVFDLTNSPFKDAMVKQAKNYLENYEKQCQEYQQYQSQFQCQEPNAIKLDA